MKKIWFNDECGLTEAVLKRRKTMVRYPIVHPKRFKGHDDVVLEFSRRPGANFCYDCVVLDSDDHELGQLPLPYEVGDVLAVGQSYSSISIKHDDWLYNQCAEEGINADNLLYEKGWFNKMLVRADLIPHQVRITDLWFDNLCHISDEDCMREGIFIDETAPKCYQPFYTFEGSIAGGSPCGYHTPYLAFSEMMKKIVGLRKWLENPWSVVYTFELIK